MGAKENVRQNFFPLFSSRGPAKSVRAPVWPPMERPNADLAALQVRSMSSVLKKRARFLARSREPDVGPPRI
jgi:hypothetical protein